MVPHSLRSHVSCARYPAACSHHLQTILPLPCPPPSLLSSGVSRGMLVALPAMTLSRPLPSLCFTNALEPPMNLEKTFCLNPWLCGHSGLLSGLLCLRIYSWCSPQSMLSGALPSVCSLFLPVFLFIVLTPMCTTGSSCPVSLASTGLTRQGWQVVEEKNKTENLWYWQHSLAVKYRF